jgi:hypothetical protein
MQNALVENEKNKKKRYKSQLNNREEMANSKMARVREWTRMFANEEEIKEEGEEEAQQAIFAFIRVIRGPL